MDYKQQLQTKEWKIKRLEIILSAQGRCEMCGDSNLSHLQVHHKKYIHGKMVWEYGRENLICLCRCCHRTVHNSLISNNRYNEILEKMKISNIILNCINHG